MDPREPQAPAWIVGPTGGHATKLGPVHGLHVTPYLDTREHEPNAACWCQPTLVLIIRRPVISGGEWIHHAADGRPHEPRHAARLAHARAHGPADWDARNGKVVAA